MTGRLHSVSCFVISGVVGCGGASGPELATVKGVVKLDGQPLPQARVVFQPTGPKGSPSIGQTASDGSFEVMFNRNKHGAMVGTHKVRVTTADLLTDETGRETEVKERIPARFNTQTELTYDVKSGENSFEILVESKGTISTQQKPQAQLANPCL